MEIYYYSYLVVSLIEQTANVLGRKDTSLSILMTDIELRKQKVDDNLRLFRNKIVHYPFDYSGLYTLLNKNMSRFTKSLYRCSELTGASSEMEIDSALSKLLKYYRDNK